MVYGHTEVRLAGTLAACNRLAWALNGIRTPSGDAKTALRIFLDTVATVLRKYTGLFAKGVQHHDAVVETLIESHHKLFIPAEPDEDEGRASEGTDAQSNRDSVSRKIATKGVCPSWLANSRCNDDDCDLAHPGNQCGLAHGINRGGSRGKGGQSENPNWWGTSNWNDWGSGPSSSTKTRRGKGGGKGKGKGGKGKGGGGRGGGRNRYGSGGW